jgi:hypothetical protein
VRRGGEKGGVVQNGEQNSRVGLLKQQQQQRRIPITIVMAMASPSLHNALLQPPSKSALHSSSSSSSSFYSSSSELRAYCKLVGSTVGRRRVSAVTTVCIAEPVEKTSKLIMLLWSSFRFIKYSLCFFFELLYRQMACLLAR